MAMILKCLKKAIYDNVNIRNINQVTNLTLGTVFLKNASTRISNSHMKKAVVRKLNNEGALYMP